MDLQDNNATETTSLNAQGQMTNNGENTGCAFGPMSGAQSPNALANVEQGIEDILRENDERLIAIQVAYHRACNDYNQTTSGRVFQQDMNSFFPPDALMAYYEDNSEHIDATDIQQQTVSFGSSQVQQFGGASDNVHTSASAFNNNVTPYVQLLPQQMGSPVNTTTFRLMNISGQVVAFCADANGSRFIQQAIEVATTEEIIMVYKEIMPYARVLSIDVFGNHAIQTILNHGPQFYKRMFIDHLMGHVFVLSSHMYGCRVIQKVLEVAEQDQKMEMAKELSSKVLICVCDKFANYVIQKCIECLPSNHIEFIFQSLYGKAATLSTHLYGWHVVKKVLAYSRHNWEIHQTVTAEIIEFAKVLSADQYGNYVVQHLVEHGGPTKRSKMVKKFAGRIVSMSHHKHAFNVIEKCLIFGCHHDRHLIADEIIGDSGGHHLMDMMIHPFANIVIQKMVETAEDEHIGVLVRVARSNIDNLKRNHHGRHVIFAIEKFLAPKVRRMVLPV